MLDRILHIAARIYVAGPAVYAVAMLVGLVVLVGYLLWEERREARRQERERDDA